MNYIIYKCCSRRLCYRNCRNRHNQLAVRVTWLLLDRQTGRDFTSWESSLPVLVLPPLPHNVTPDC